MTVPDASNRHRLHHLLWECNLAMVPLIDEVFAGSELSLPLTGTLDEIGVTPGVTIADIARRTPKTQQAISQAVAKLEKLGLIERRLGSGRGVGLHLTTTGEQARIDGIAREEQIEVGLVELLGTQVYEELMTALEHARSRLPVEEAAQPTKVSHP